MALKADIDKRGTLTISGETTIDIFALTQWWEMWQQHKALLLVNTVDRATDGSGELDTHYKQVDQE